MSALTFTLVETSGIQRFIFASNDLRENLGASELVRLVTEEWAFAVLDKIAPRHNVDRQAGVLQPERRIEQGNLDAEVIYYGGGGIALLFAGEDPLERAKDFVFRVSRKALLEAPGLSLRAAHVPFDFETGDLSKVKAEAQRLLQCQPGGGQPLLGLSVTAADTSTGWPTVGMTRHGEPASAQRLAKLAAADLATLRLRETLQLVREAGFEFADQLDQLGGKPGEEDYIAVVHLDGNGMASRRFAYESQFAGQGEQANRAYIEGMRHFSDALRLAAARALQEAAGELLAILPDPEPGQVFPVRPIVFGGDDITLVCDGPLGVRLAVDYIEAFQKEVLADGQPGYATAGIAIVKTHYPFSRAYHLSEELRKSARDRVVQVLGSKQGGAVDWHITEGGLLGSLDEIRRREYLGGRLLTRPLLVGRKDPEHRDWETFVRLWNDFNQDDWRKSRNKRAALREVLRQGDQAVRQFRHAYRQKDGRPIRLLPVDPGGLGEDGWIGDRCLHYDALEALEMVELEVGR